MLDQAACAVAVAAAVVAVAVAVAVVVLLACCTYIHICMHSTYCNTCTPDLASQ